MLAAARYGTHAVADSARPGTPYALPALTGRVVDRAKLLPPDRERAIDARLAAVERATRHQFVVVTVPSLGGHSIEAYALKLGNSWGIGRKGHDDGVLLIVAPRERKVRIEVGRGLDAALRDDEAAAILQHDVLPAFRKGDFPGGIAAGVEGVIREITPQQRKAA